MFNQFNLSPTLLANIEELEYAQPTKVQREGIPAVLAGRNLVVTAETGSGKTAAFLIPIIQRLSEGTTGHLQALVLCPTREIALQTTDFAHALGRGTTVRAAPIYGGVGYTPQEQALRTGVEIIVATPGRLLDHIQRGNAKLNRVSYVVIDEADRLMDMGFMPDLKKILRYLPEKRQTVLFSATMPPEIMALVRSIMSDPVRIEVGQVAMPPQAIEQTVFPVAPERKTDLLVSLLRGRLADDMHTVLVFCHTKRRAERLATDLARAKLDVTAIHGDRTQSQRETALLGFRQGKFRILVATDVAARGLDVEGISHVINYDLPEAAEVYVHRIGRTARAGAAGQAYSFLAPDDRSNLARIEKALGERIPRLTIADFAPPTADDGQSKETQVVSTTARSASAGTAGARPMNTWPRS
jgi:ATP-dependent RNA helicase RhlE